MILLIEFWINLNKYILIGFHMFHQINIKPVYIRVKGIFFLTQDENIVTDLPNVQYYKMVHCDINLLFYCYTEIFIYLYLPNFGKVRHHRYY